MLLKGIKISRPRTKIADQIQWKCIVTKWSNYAVSNKHVLVNVQSVFVENRGVYWTSLFSYSSVQGIDMTFIVNMKFHHHFIHFFCHADVNECASDPCLHGGTCVDGINSYRCLCPPGWGGAHCQLDSDECSGSPCVNAHSCQDLQGGYKCHCQTGWTGKNCDISTCPDIYPYIKTQDHVFQKCNEI